MGASRGMMVLFVKQVHLQKEVGAASERGGKVLAGPLQRRSGLVGGAHTGCGSWGEEGG